MRRFIGFLISLQLLSFAQPAFAAFDTDISPAITYVEGMQMLPSMDDGLFHAEKALTRLELVTGIVRTVYKNDVGDHCFNNIASSVPAHFTHLFRDVPRESAHAKELCVGILTGIIEGNEDGSFQGAGGTTLVDAAKIITKAYDIAPLPGLRPVSGIPWHEPYWYALAKRNAIPDSVKDRQASLTRGEFAEIVYTLHSDKVSSINKHVELRRLARIAKWNATPVGLAAVNQS